MQLVSYGAQFQPGLYLFEATEETPIEFRECRCTLIELVRNGNGKLHFRRRGQVKSYPLQGLAGELRRVSGVDAHGNPTNVEVMTSDTRPDLIELFEAYHKTQKVVADGRLQLIEDRHSLQQPPTAEWLKPLGFVADIHSTVDNPLLILATPAELSLSYQLNTGKFFVAEIFDLPLDLYNTRRAVLRLLRGLGVDFYLRGDLLL